MERIDELVGRKREILQHYLANIADLPGVTLNREEAGTVIGAWMPTAVFEQSTGVTREQLLAAFAANNIDARVFFYPLSRLPMFREWHPNRHAWDIPGRAINLPSYHDITPNDQDRITAVIRGCLGV
jgi:perosamine synthetase